MTANEHLNIVSKAIEKLRPAPSGTYELVVINRQIILRKYNRHQATWPLIARLDSTEVNRGCTSKKWGLIKDRIRHLIAGGTLS